MLRIEFETDNDAFEDSLTSEVARILREIANKIENGDDLGGGSVKDVNGNTIGSWELTPST